MSVSGTNFEKGGAEVVWQGRELYFIMLCGMCIMLRFVRRLKIKNNYFFKDIPML